MARPLPNNHPLMQHKLLGFLPAAIASFMALTAIFAVFSAVIFLCGAHHGMLNSVMGKEKKKTVRLGGEDKKNVMEKMKSSKALLMSKMVSWRKVDSVDSVRDEEEDVGGDDQDDVVWKKTIIKGEKCRPLEFSGQILYDADGNLLPDYVNHNG